MSESAYAITHVQLKVSVDPGHGGPFSEYKIEADGDGYAVALRVSQLPRNPSAITLPPPPQPPTAAPQSSPAPGATAFKPWYMTEILPKDRRQVEEFLSKLATEYNVYELADLKFPFFLHPTIYSFSFQDSGGQSHSFEYRIECSNHLDEKYKALVEEFESFFESRRVFAEFYESQRNV